MMIGSTWKAKATPSSGRTGPKRNSMPELEVFMTAWTPSVSSLRARRPRSQYRTMTAKAIWMMRAPITVRRFIARWLFESRNAMAIRTTTPARPHNTCMPLLPFGVDSSSPRKLRVLQPAHSRSPLCVGLLPYG